MTGERGWKCHSGRCLGRRLGHLRHSLPTAPVIRFPDPQLQHATVFHGSNVDDLDVDVPDVDVPDVDVPDQQLQLRKYISSS